MVQHHASYHSQMSLTYILIMLTAKFIVNIKAHFSTTRRQICYSILIIVHTYISAGIYIAKGKPGQTLAYPIAN